MPSPGTRCSNSTACLLTPSKRSRPITSVPYHAASCSRVHWKGCCKISTRTPRTSTQASGGNFADRSRASLAESASRSEWIRRAGRLRVIAPMVNTPAYEAGILAGDQIVEIDGQSAEGMSPDKAAEFLMGRPGTDVKLSVLHEGSEDPEPISITRAIIEVPTVIGDRRKPDDRWDFMLDKDKKIGYIRIVTFSQNTPDELKKALEQLKEEGAKGLIVDLRDDPGGLLSAAVEISDMFLDSGEIVSTKGRNTPHGGTTLKRTALYEDLPMAVIVNQNSASASEILAAALQDHKRAVIVGQRSYGKGSVQNIIDLDGGKSVLKLTVASYYRPSGENIHRFKNAKTSDKWGVSPNPDAEGRASQQRVHSLVHCPTRP